MSNKYTPEMRKNIAAARRNILAEVNEAVEMGFISPADKNTFYNFGVKRYLEGCYDSLKAVMADDIISKGN